MYWLVEDEKQIRVLINSGYKEAFIEIIPYNYNTHPVLNGVSLIYIRPIYALKGYIVCVTHSEALSVLNASDGDVISELLNKFDTLYCRDKKEILHYFPLKALYDINTPPTTYIPTKTQAHEILYRQYRDEPHINLFVPIVKHYEYCEKIFEDLKTNINKPKTEYDEFFNNRVSVVFNAIERSGIRVQRETFEQYFPPINSEFAFTQFNLKTTTTRPSNKFGGVNYAALNKENGCRKSFIPRNDKFIEIDITAYHPNLAAKLIGYKFPTEDIHGHFAELYNVDYAKSKELTFKQLYGGVFAQYKELEFFKRIEEFVTKNWNEFNDTGKIKVPVSNYEFEKERLENMNPQKLFNYVLQNLETSMNVCILWDMFRVLKGYETKLVLYTYDSFLFDFKEGEEELLSKIKDIFKKYKLNTKENNGYDYDFK